MGNTHLADMRVAQKLWTIFPHAANSQDPVLKCSLGMNVPDALQQHFDLEVVTDHRWGIYMQNQPMKHTPAPSRAAVRYSSPKQRMRRAELLAAQFQSTKQRLRSPSTSPLRRRSQGPAVYALGGSRQAETQRRTSSGERPSGKDAPAPNAKRWWYP